ncbi:hypothetical protein OIO90_004703 [Microbotryomycetes sp. JL221]|nr:hypothetical protein OIO90_004703 [Microbotryomycetes sp. JL221]
MSSAQARLSAVSGAMSGGFPQGLLKDDVAIVTGAAQGIGRAIALAFAKENAKVVVSDLDAKKAQHVVDEIKKNGGDAIVVAGDVTADDFPKKLVSETVAKYGKINIIINNAGFTADKMFHTMGDDIWDLILKVHCTAPFRIVREAAPYLRSKDPKALTENRAIVNVSSIAGLHGNVGQANYSLAKAGIVGLSKTLAKELGAFNVRVNTAAFGYVLTRLTGDKSLGEAMEIGGKKIALGIPQPKGGAPSGPVPGIPLGRPANPEEAANAVLFLASPLASFVSGHTLEITGGQGI